MSRSQETQSSTDQSHSAGVRAQSGTLLRDSHEITVANNLFAGASHAIRKDARSTDVADIDNRLRS